MQSLVSAQEYAKHLHPKTKPDFAGGREGDLWEITEGTICHKTDNDLWEYDDGTGKPLYYYRLICNDIDGFIRAGFINQVHVD